MRPSAEAPKTIGSLTPRLRGEDGEGEDERRNAKELRSSQEE